MSDEIVIEFAQDVAPEIDPRTVSHQLVNGVPIPIIDSEIQEVVFQHPPVTVTMVQARKALILSGVSMIDVEAALAAIPDDTARALAQVDLEYSTTVRSTSPLVQSVGAALGVSVDDLFRLAVTL